ncbi:MAG: hypothetical protein ABIF08_04320 [Nanoarchaeota archaeon]
MAVSKKLSDYVQEQINEGYKPQLIKDVLLDAGYYIGDIEHVLKQARALPKPHQKSHYLSKYLSTLSFLRTSKSSKTDKPSEPIKKTEKLKPAILSERAKLGFYLTLIGSVLLFIDSFILLLLNPSLLSSAAGLFIFNIIPISVTGLVSMTIKIIFSAIIMISAFIMYRRGSERIGGSMAIIAACFYFLISTIFFLGPFFALVGGIAGIVKK